MLPFIHTPIQTKEPSKNYHVFPPLNYSAEINEQTNLLVLHFFGSIDAEHTSHEIRGLNVIVRLAKTSVDWAWPQLTAENVKMHWLSYDYNAIQTDDIYLDKGDSGKFVAWYRRG